MRFEMNLVKIVESIVVVKPIGMEYFTLIDKLKE